MSSQTSYTRLGIFVIAALALLVALAVFIGGGNSFRKKVIIETYFDESVQGLDIGSKVRYRGVVIGAVSDISFTYTRYEQEKSPAERKQYVLVEMTVYPDLLGTKDANGEYVDKMVAEGLRVRMAPVGITGIAYVEMDFIRNSSLLPIHWEPDHYYIPSARSTMLSFVEAAERIIERLGSLDIEGPIKNLDHLLITVNRKVDAISSDKLSHELSATLDELRKTLAHIDQLVDNKEVKGIPTDLATAARRLKEIADSAELKRVLAVLDRSAQRIDHALDGREQDVADLIINLRATSANLKALSENLKRDPSGTLLAAPPKPSDALTP